MMHEVAIIGAGMAGIACAGALRQAGLAPVVLDKGRGIGGRMATRRLDLGGEVVRLDHGAQYLTARSEGFARLLEELSARGAAAIWGEGRERPRWVGLPGMSGLVGALAAGLDLRQGWELRSVSCGEEGWRLLSDRGELAARIVVLTPPAPQIASLLGPGHPLAPALARVRMQPCLTLMAAFPPDSPAPFETEAPADHPLAWIARNSSRPGRGGGPVTWVAQAGPDWSARHIETPREQVAALMLPLLQERIGSSGRAPLAAIGHKWRFAQAAAPLGRPFLQEGTLFAGGDWCLGQRAEDAWASGQAMARAILDLPPAALGG